MRRHRNPRYAPESLERKLNPSGIVAIPVAAEVYVPNTQLSPPAPATPIVVPPADSMSVAPANPMATSSVLVFSSDSPTSVGYATAPTAADPVPTPTPSPDPVPTIPGDPEPVSPPAPVGGTDPEPPDGDGEPPLDLPSTPGGPVVPALG